MKLFSSRVKESFKPIILQRKGDGFLLFLKAFFEKPYLWVTLGDFTLKNANLGAKSVFNWKLVR